MMVGRIILLLGLTCVPVAAQAPPQRLYDHNIHTWFVYAGDHPVAGRWGLHLEAQFRRHDGGVQPQQLLLRPALNYQLNSRIALSAGYAYVTVEPSLPSRIVLRRVG